MGPLIIYLTLTGKLTTHTSYQLTINLWVAQTTLWLQKYLGFMPQVFWALLVLAILVLLFILFQKKLKGGTQSN